MGRHHARLLVRYRGLICCHHFLLFRELVKSIPKIARVHPGHIFQPGDYTAAWPDCTKFHTHGVQKSFHQFSAQHSIMNPAQIPIRRICFLRNIVFANHFNNIANSSCPTGYTSAGTADSCLVIVPSGSCIMYAPTNTTYSDSTGSYIFN